MPRECVVCGRTLIPQERHICLECLSDLPETHFASVRCNPMADRFNEKISSGDFEPYAYAAALFHYGSEAGYRKITQALKYHRDFGAGRYFAEMLGERLRGSELFSDVDIVVPVPLHWTRHWRRGYNQAALIAEGIAGELGCRCGTRLLRRNRRTKTQTRVQVSEKAGNVSGAFSVRKTAWKRLSRENVKHILLVDDVFTTGATLSSCYRTLRAELGPEVRISVATLGVVGCQ